MQDTKKLRVRYNNEWPSRFLFPAEQLLQKRLAENNLQQVFVPATLKDSEEAEFHGLLGNFLEALDQLPYRPDAAFDCIWKTLDAEFFRVKDESSLPQHVSRFEAFQARIATGSNTSKAFYPLIDALPMQTCEFVAKRILRSRNVPDSHSEVFLKRVKSCLGEQLYSAFCAKYDLRWSTQPESAQRSAGAFLRKLVQGSELELSGARYALSKHQAVSFLISVVMAQFRNERFHGTTFPPFRSSAAKLKTYAHAYFLLLIAYALLLEVFLYRDFKVIEEAEVAQSVAQNQTLFLTVFRNAIDK